MPASLICYCRDRSSLLPLLICELPLQSKKLAPTFYQHSLNCPSPVYCAAGPEFLTCTPRETALSVRVQCAYSLLLPIMSQTPLFSRVPQVTTFLPPISVESLICLQYSQIFLSQSSFPSGILQPPKICIVLVNLHTLHTRFFFHLGCFSFSKMSYGWGHIACNLFRLISFISQYTFRIPLYLFVS